MSIVTGKLPAVFAITLQDITPYGNDVYHLTSILQPSTATSAPCVGVAITTETAVPGCATGASHLSDMEQAARFVIEVAKAFIMVNANSMMTKSIAGYSVIRQSEAFSDYGLARRRRGRLNHTGCIHRRKG